MRRLASACKLQEDVIMHNSLHKATIVGNGNMQVHVVLSELQALWTMTHCQDAKVQVTHHLTGASATCTCYCSNAQGQSCMQHTAAA